MVNSRKRPSGKLAAAVARFVADHALRGKTISVGLSGGVDSVTLLHLLRNCSVKARAIHVNHGLSADAGAWAAFCRRLCKRWSVPLTVRRVKVARAEKGLEAAAREARYAAFRRVDCDVLMLAHHLDDQAETVLMNLLRGAGARGASGMPALGRLDGKLLARPLLDVRRGALVAYARSHGLEWVDDESNADESLTRNYVRRRLGPLLEARFPRWRESLARAARHFSAADFNANHLLRSFLASRGLRAPSEAKLVEMLKQLTSRGARTLIEHDGATLRTYRGKLVVSSKNARPPFAPLAWRGERRLPIPALGGELLFRRARGQGIDPDFLSEKSCTVKLRSGGERLQPHARRPRRTLKNLFQEAGIAPWERDRLPLLYCGSELAWVARLGIDERFRASADTLGWVPQWRSKPLFLRKSQAARGKIAA